MTPALGEEGGGRLDGQKKTLNPSKNNKKEIAVVAMKGVHSSTA